MKVDCYVKSKHTGEWFKTKGLCQCGKIGWYENGALYDDDSVLICDKDIMYTKIPTYAKIIKEVELPTFAIDSYSGRKLEVKGKCTMCGAVGWLSGSSLRDDDGDHICSGDKDWYVEVPITTPTITACHAIALSEIVELEKIIRKNREWSGFVI